MPVKCGKPEAFARQIPADSALPNLPHALDEKAMRDVLQSTIVSRRPVGASTGARRDIRSCAITRIKHKAGRYCQVCYQLTVADERERAEHTGILSARVYPRGTSASRYLEAVRQPLVETEFGAPIYHLPELDMVLWVFPNDRKLEKLPQFIDRRAIAGEILPAIISNRYGRGWQIACVQQEIVHHVPELACTARVRVGLRHAGGAFKRITVYGKTYENPDIGARSYRNMLRLWESDLRGAGQFNMAMPLGYHAATQSLWQAGLEGETMMALRLDGREMRDRAAPAAKCVAALHLIPLSVAAKTNVALILRRLEGLPKLIAEAWPRALPVADRAVRELLRQAAYLPPAKPALLHGDLHLKNFFLSSEKVYLIDLDNLLQGPPAHDLGSFFAALLYRGKMDGADPANIRRLLKAFLRAYRSNGGRQISDFETGWFTAAMLMTERVYRCLTRLKAGRLDIVHELIGLAERIASCPAGEWGGPKTR